MCAASKNCEKFTKTSFSELQGRSRSSMLINPKSRFDTNHECNRRTTDRRTDGRPDDG